MRVGWTTIRSFSRYSTRGDAGADARQHVLHFAARGVEALFEQEAAIEHRAADVGDARRLDAVHRLAAEDAVDVEGGLARQVGDDRHLACGARPAPASAPRG